MAISLLFPVVSTIQPLALDTRHEQHAADARLQVLVGQPGGLAARARGASIAAKRHVGLLDGHRREVDAEALGQRARRR